MPYIDDLIASDSKTPEVFSASLSDIEFMSHELAKKHFPEVELSLSKNVSYFPFKLCHSYPVINARGRTFTPEVLANSFASLNDQLIDFEHSLEDNGTGRDRIIGHVKATRFINPSPSSTEVSSRKKTPPKEALPVLALGALFLRAKGVKEIVEAHVSKKQTWQVSMECGHRWKDAYVLYRDELIPLPDADSSLRDCIKPDHIMPYKGHEIAAFLGGLTGSVDFWGAALTQTPADSNADILSFIGGVSRDAASKTSFFLPLFSFGKEVANTPGAVDKKINELSNISPIGETEPAEDGHKHQILSNLIVVPSHGHSHSFSAFNLSRGTNPTLTGVTYEHSIRMGSSDPYTYVSHLHMVNIPLKGKLKNGSSAPEEEEYILEEADVTKLQKLLEGLDETFKKFSSAATGDKASLEAEFASKRRELMEFAQKDIEEAKKKEYEEELIKSGKFLTKEKADEAIAAAEKKAQDEMNEKLRIADIKQKRIEKCVELKIPLDTIYEGIKTTDGKEMTFKDKLELLPTDASGDQMFQMDLQAWVAALKEEENTQQQTSQQQTQTLQEAASKRRILPIAGGGNSEASSGKTSKEAASVPKHLLGRRSLKAVK